MPFRPPFVLSRAPATVLSSRVAPLAWTFRHRGFHASGRLRNDVAVKNHYERLDLRTDATPGDIKKSFYKLSKTHHPDANRSDPNAANTFSLLSESYTILSDPSRRAAYDRDVLRLHQTAHAAHPRGSYHSTGPAGGRTASGLSRRRTTFRGPPPSFYRSGGWGEHADKRRAAHDESTGGAEHHAGAGAANARSSAWDSAERARHAGMGPGSDPFGHRDEVPHFDKDGHTRTHRRQDDRRRWRREHRAMGDDDVEFEPQMSLATHFLVVAGILGVTFLAPVIYLQFTRLGRKKRDDDH